MRVSHRRPCTTTASSCALLSPKRDPTICVTVHRGKRAISEACSASSGSLRHSGGNHTAIHLQHRAARRGHRRRHELLNRRQVSVTEGGVLAAAEHRAASLARELHRADAGCGVCEGAGKREIPVGWGGQPTLGFAVDGGRGAFGGSPTNVKSAW